MGSAKRQAKTSRHEKIALALPFPRRKQSLRERHVKFTALKEELQLSTSPGKGELVSRCLLGCMPLSALVLGLQASAPFSHGPAAPNFVNWFLLVSLLLGAGELFRRGDAGTRVAVGFVLVALLQLLTITQWFQAPSLDHLGSVLSAQLSSTWNGMPMLGLYQAWCALGVGWLSYLALKSSLFSVHPWAKPMSMGISGFIALVGVRAVIGYATGSTSLLAG